MPKRSSIAGIRDEMATLILEAAESGKNPAAVALGRLGGRIGGKARAKKLSAKERSQIASLAAQARWKKNDRTKRSSAAGQ